MTIVVLGSINMDLVVEAPRLPIAGETLKGTRFYQAPGGKGANQAVAAALQGATTQLIGRIGQDELGAVVLSSLRGSNVRISGVSLDPAVSTGVALIVVAQSGENTIVTVGGANHRVGEDEVRTLERMLGRASLLCVQLEIPLAIVDHAVGLAKDAGVPVMLDPAPVTTLPDVLLAGLAWITPNEVETEALTGIAPLDETDALHAAEALRARGVEHVVITRGAEGCFYSGPEGSFRVDAPSVDVVDTVASGDAFNGALAAAIAGGEGVGSALERACAAGALAATRPGAQPSLPTAADVDRLLASG